MAVLGLAGVAAAAAVVRRRRRRIDVAGRIALVTGGSRGLGLLIARELVERGARVAICARDADELERARRKLRSAGADVLAVQADVSDPRSVKSLFAAVYDRWGTVDILVNNAGIIDVGPFWTMNDDDFRRAMDINFWGMLNTVLAAVPAMRARGSGRIVNITSIGGRISVPHLLPYSVAKFAGVGLSEGLHAELARDGIRVTTVVPGLMRTGSAVNAVFRGDARKEYVWFSVSSSSPLTSTKATRAARRIVRAVERGEGLVTLTWQAKLATRIKGLAPATVAGMLTFVNRLLPDGDGNADGPVRGGLIEVPELAARFSARMRRAAMRNNELAELQS